MVLTVIIILIVVLLNPNTRYKKLSITQTKWDSIIEARTASDSLQLDEIQFNDYILPIDKNADTIYYSLVNDSKTKYNPNISFEANQDKVKLAILEDDITDKKVHSDYQFKMMIYDNEEYHIYNLVCTDFPILNITYNTDEMSKNKDKNISVDISVFDNMETSTKRVTNSKGILDIHNINGNKDYNLKLTMKSPGKNQRKNSISIFNMSPHNEYLLTQEEVVNTDGPKDFKVELFINNEYQGQYSIKNGMGNVPKMQQQ